MFRICIKTIQNESFKKKFIYFHQYILIMITIYQYVFSDKINKIQKNHFEDTNK